MGVGHPLAVTHGEGLVVPGREEPGELVVGALGQGVAQLGLGELGLGGVHGEVRAQGPRQTEDHELFEFAY